MFIAFTTGGVVHRYGKRGEKQKGIDFYADLPDGTRHTYQCRRYKRFTKQNALKARDEMFYRNSRKHFVLIASEAGTTVLDTFDRWKRWEILDVIDLSRQVAMMDLEKARRLLDLSFGAAYRREFLAFETGRMTSYPTTYRLSEEAMSSRESTPSSQAPRGWPSSRGREASGRAVY
jgi:hypothetical protein